MDSPDEKTGKEFLPPRTRCVLRYILEQNARKFASKDCVVFEDNEVWTYAQALQEAYRAANALSSMGIKRGDHILVFLPNNQWWIRTWWGITFLGAVMVPVNYAYKGNMLKHICEDSQSTHMITSPERAARLKDLELELSLIQPEWLIRGSNDKPILDRPIEPWDIHAIVYTSGTTGPSKGCITPYFQTYMNALLWWSKATEEDTFLLDLPLFHIGAHCQAYALWVVGGRIALRSIFSGSRYLEVVRKCGATMAAWIGTIHNYLEKMPPQPDDADNPLRAVLVPSSGDPSSLMARYGIKEVYVIYGMTELSGPILDHGPVPASGSCGKIRPGVELRIVDAHDIPVQQGEIGELIVRSDLPWEMNLGYYNRPEETARTWQNGWFHTGDMFTCDASGNYYFGGIALLCG